MNVEKCAGSGSNHPKWFGLALQALVILSRDQVQTCPSAELALHLQSEPTLLRRILAILAREGILETREGRDGGYRLRKDPHAITLADIFDALQVADPLRCGIKDTTGSNPFGLGMNAIFSELADEMDKSLKALLGTYTLGDLADRANRCEGRQTAGD